MTSVHKTSGCGRAWVWCAKDAMRGSLSGFAACCALATACLLQLATSADLNNASPSSAKITFNLDKRHAITETLWGIFFEEARARLLAELMRMRSCVDLISVASTRIAAGSNTVVESHRCGTADPACRGWRSVRRTDPRPTVWWPGILFRFISC